MRVIVVVLLALAIALSAPAPARAQQPVTRADSADVLIGTAERLHAQGSTEIADALARLVQRRYADTPAHARATALLALARATERSRAGRAGLVSFTTLYGSWLGAAVPLMLDAETPEAYGLGLLTGAPLGFAVGYLYADAHSVSAGDAGLISWSGSWGTWQGLGWMLALGDDDECADLCYESDPEAREVVGSAVIGGLVGIGASMVAADRTDVTGGTATMIGWGSLWGTWAGIVTSVLADLDTEEDRMLIATLIGGDIGFASMAVLAPRWDMSSGRAWLINASGVMGGAIGGGVDLLIGADDEDVAILIPALGSAAGLYLGAYLTRDYDEGRVRGGMLGDPIDDSGALVRLRDGDWRVALPQPTPALLRSDRRDDGELGVRVQLLDARF